jgi:hypothetical protein
MKELLTSASRLVLLILVLGLVSMTLTVVVSNVHNEQIANSIITAFVATISAATSFYFSSKNIVNDVSTKNSVQKGE